MIENKVKLVIWDLDETFWSGTLAEEGMTPIDGNVEKVLELSKRGIVNSICSKNDYERAKAKLVELGVWEYFVFPSISFNPKGQAIAQMIEGAALRAENVLFVDDNPMNLEEVKFFNPGIMVSHPKDVLDRLLDHPQLAGKPDPEMIRLKQYQFLQRKVEERSASTVSNEEFLRLSNIRVAIDYDIEANFDRVVELINRTNQLNYTKERLEDPRSIRQFRKMLRAYGTTAGCVWVSDNYGDYGLAGFFMLRRRVAKTRLVHFVFSCRTMNMGVEQYVYELLDKPPIDIVQPVSYSLDTHATVDWINATHQSSGESNDQKGGRLLLLGGCDLLQLANYCSTNRLEFANVARDDYQVRFDDPGFVLNDRNVLRENSGLLPTWSYDDVVKFDEGIAASDLVLLALYDVLNGNYYEINGCVRVRAGRELPEARSGVDMDVVRSLTRDLDIDLKDRTQLLLECFDAIARNSKPDAQIFVIGYPSLASTNPKKIAKRRSFNDICRKYCESHSRFRFLDVDMLLPREELVTERHFSPAGYFTLARHILSLSGMPGPALQTRDIRKQDRGAERISAESVSVDS